MSDTEPVGPPAEAAASPKHGGRTTRLLGIAVVALLIEAGFVAPIIDRRLGDIHWAQARRMTPLRALERLTQDRYAVCVRKPQ